MSSSSQLSLTSSPASRTFEEGIRRTSDISSLEPIFSTAVSPTNRPAPLRLPPYGESTSPPPPYLQIDSTPRTSLLNRQVAPIDWKNYIEKIWINGALAITGGCILGLNKENMTVFAFALMVIVIAVLMIGYNLSIEPPKKFLPSPERHDFV